MNKRTPEKTDMVGSCPKKGRREDLKQIYKYMQLFSYTRISSHKSDKIGYCSDSLTDIGTIVRVRFFDLHILIYVGARLN